MGTFRESRSFGAHSVCANGHGGCLQGLSPFSTSTQKFEFVLVVLCRALSFSEVSLYRRKLSSNQSITCNANNVYRLQWIRLYQKHCVFCRFQWEVLKNTVFFWCFVNRKFRGWVALGAGPGWATQWGAGAFATMPHQQRPAEFFFCAQTSIFTAILSHGRQGCVFWRPWVVWSQT